MTDYDQCDNRHDGHDLGYNFKNAIDLSLLGVSIIAIGGLLGYFTGLRVLGGSFSSSYVPIAPSTSACFLIFCIALFYHKRKSFHGSTLWAFSTTILVLIVFGLLSFVRVIFGKPINLEDKLFPTAESIGKIPVWQMSPVAGVTIALFGLGVLLLLNRGKSLRNIRCLGHCASFSGVLTALIGITVLLAYMFGSPLMYGGSEVPMAVMAAFGFILLGSALTMTVGHTGFFIRRFSGNSTSASLSRIFIPVVAIAFFLQSLISKFLSSSLFVQEVLIQAILLMVIGLIMLFVVDLVARSTGGKIDEATKQLSLSMKELKESEEHHRDILRTAMDGIMMTDIAGRIKEVNDAYCRMSGYTVEELSTMSIADLAVVATADGVSARIHQIIELGKLRFESKHRRKDGSIYDVEVSAMYRSTKGGNLVVFLRDITDRKLIENAHLQSGHLLQLASTHSDLNECMAALTASLQDWSGCEAVG